MSTATELLLFGNATAPKLDFNFLGGSLDPRIAFTRASTATYFDASGTLRTATTNTPRFDYGPTPGATPLGLLIEPQATNAVRNNTMIGAVAGNPGTMPNNWVRSGNDRVVTASVVENGITAIDVELVGAGPVGGSVITFDAVVTQPATPGQSWTGSLYAKLVGGTLTNVTDVEVTVRYYDNTSTFISQQFTIFVPTNASLSTQRVSQTFVAPANTAFVNMGLRYNTSGAFDCTLRIGLPQLEVQGGTFSAGPTSVIATLGIAATRANDIAIATTPVFTGGNMSIASTCVIDHYAVGTPLSLKPGALSDGTNANRLANAILVTSGQVDAFLNVAGTTFTTPVSAAVPLNTPISMVATREGTTLNSYYSKARFSIACSAAYLPVTQLRLGGDPGGNVAPIWVQNVAAWNRALNRAEAIALT